MRIEVSFTRPRYVMAEDVALRVCLLNDGPAAVTVPDPFHATNWQPVYQLWRDGDGSAQRVTFRGAHFDDHRDPPEGVDPVLRTLTPGERLEDEVPLRAWAGLDAPGRYHVVASLSWEGVQAQSPEAIMEIPPPSLDAISIGVNVGVDAVRDPWLTWLHRDAQEVLLGQSLYHETRPDLGELERESGEVVHPVRPSVVAVYTPWTTYDRVEALTFWRVWRDGQHLAAHEVSLPDPVWLPLGEGAAVIHPVVMARGGALSVCLRGADGALSAARFTTVGVTEHKGPSLPGALVAARVTPDPARGGEGFAVLALCERDSGGIAGVLARFDGDAGWSEVPFSADELVPTPRCAVGVTLVDGAPRGGFFALTREGSELVRVEVAADGAVSLVERLGRADEPPWASAVSYGLSPGAAGETHWVVLPDPTRAFSSRGATPQPLPGRALMPLDPLAISQSLYLPLHDPRDGVVFHMLR